MRTGARRRGRSPRRLQGPPRRPWCPGAALGRCGRPAVARGVRARDQQGGAGGQGCARHRARQPSTCAPLVPVHHRRHPSVSPVDVSTSHRPAGHGGRAVRSGFGGRWRGIGGELVVTEPKTAKSRRTLPLDAAAIAHLKAQRTAQLEERLRAGSAWVDTGHVFTTRAGCRWTRETFCVRSLLPLRRLVSQT